MALVQKTKTDKIEIVNVDTIPMIQVRKATWAEDDVTGEIIGSKVFHRHVVAPDSDTANEEAIVKNVANTVHTAQVKAAYKARLAANSKAPI